MSETKAEATPQKTKDKEKEDPIETLGNGWERRSDLAEPLLVEVADVWQTGSDRGLARAIVHDIDAAQSLVLVVSFLLSDGEIVAALERAARRGVRVYLLLCTEVRLEDDIGDSEFNQRVYDEHLAMLQRLAGWCCIRSARVFHAKVVLVDPALSRSARTRQGWLLTANLGREPLERNEELAVKLAADEIDGVWRRAVHAFWELAEHEFLSPGGRGTAPKGMPVQPARRLPAPSSTKGEAILGTTPDRDLRKALSALIAGAGHRIVLACYGYDVDDPIVADLCLAASKGLEVVVLARKRPKAEPALLALAEAGATVLAFDHLHAKAIVVDYARGVVMSANLEPHGLDHGFELGVRLDAERAKGLSRLLDEWELAAPWRLRIRPRREDVVGEFVPVQAPKAAKARR